MLFRRLSPVALALLLPSPAFAVISFPFSNTSDPLAYQSINYMDGVNGTDWSSYVKVGSAGAVTNLSAVSPNGDTGSVRQIGVGTDFGAGGGSRSYLVAITDQTDNFFAAVGTFASHTTTSVTWDMGNSSNSTTVRLLVQSAGSWYVTQTSYSTAATTLAQFQGAGATAVSVNLSTATWYTYNLATLTVNTGTPATLPSTDLTGAGLHLFNSTDNAVSRFDNFTLVPEPSALLLTAIGAVGLLRRRR